MDIPCTSLSSINRCLEKPSIQADNERHQNLIAVGVVAKVKVSSYACIILSVNINHFHPR